MLSNNQLQAISNYMFAQDEIFNSKYTIVLGTTLWHRPLQVAIELFQKNLSGTFIFCGGYNHKINSSEALMMATKWLQLGLPHSHIEIEDRSRNTWENFQFCKNLLIEKKKFPIEKVNIICISYHMRRAIETCRLIFGDQTKIGVINYPSIYCDPSSWFDNEHGRFLVLSEFGKIRKYLPNLVLPAGLSKIDFSVSNF